MSVPSYPKRPRFFSNKFIRLIGKVCLANEIGADACWLLTTIVSVEDAKGYRGAVTYWNAQLMAIAGVKSANAVARIRDKAIGSGWLHYEKGGKGFAGKYWVMIPPEYQGLDDGPTDENPHEYFPFSTPKSDKKAGKNRDESGKEPGRNRDHSSLSYPIQEKEYLSGSVQPHAADASNDEQKNHPAKKPSRTTPDTPHHQAIALVCESWQKRYGKKYPFNSGKDGKTIQQILKHLDGDLDQFRTVCQRYFETEDKFVLDARHSLGVLQSQLAKWMVDPNKSGKPPQPATGFIRELSEEEMQKYITPKAKENQRD